MTTITEQVAQVQETINDACARGNRNPDEVRLIAVSKKKPVEDILEAVAAGVQHFGENRVEESETKIPAVNAVVSAPVSWHMIGHIQSRKAKHVPPLFETVHSIDSVKLAEKLSRILGERIETRDVLIQINISGEESKGGFTAYGWETNAEQRDTLWNDVRHIVQLPGLNVVGLMTIAPIIDDMAQTRPIFAGLRQLRDKLAESLEIQLPELSMGMTDDYPIAIEEGATMVRVGRAIFGERQY